MKMLICALSITALIAGCNGGDSSVTSSPSSVVTDSSASIVPPVLKDAVVTGELIVKFKSSVSSEVAKTTHKSVSGNIGSATVIQEFPDLGISHIKVPTGLSDADATQIYLNSGNVEYVEPNTIINIQSAPVVPTAQYYANYQWNMPMISAPVAWETTEGSASVIIGTIDSGIDSTHPDLAPNWSGYWYNAIPGSSTTAPFDDNSHGTHVAGIIGAQGSNKSGVAGVNWKTRIAACKFIAANGTGSTANAIACVNYFNGLRSKGVNIVAVNSSWGSSTYSQALSDAMAAEPRILHIVAAGNSSVSDDFSPFYPAAFQLPNLISVAATSQTDGLSYYSDFGRHTVSVGAPGDYILSTIPGATYGIKSGTSMAAPHVSGIVGLLYAANPSMTPVAARNTVISSGDLNTSLNGGSISSKRVNAASALACSNKPLFSLVKIPAMLTVGTPATFTVLSVDCATPVGPITVTSSAQNKTFTVNNTDGLATFTYTPTSTTDTLKFSSTAGSDMITLSPPTITSVIPASFTKGQVVSIQLVGAGGTMPYVFAAASLPTGLTLTSAGKLSGTVSATGTFNSNFLIMDSRSVQTVKSIPITVNAAPAITTTSLTSGNVGMTFSQTLTATGGTAPLAWKSTSNVSGLTLTAGGVLSGTPTTVGTTSYNLTVTDANGVTVTVTLPLIILTKPTITTALSSYEQGQAVSIQLAGSGGTSPYKYSGTVPSGLTLSSSGLISGTLSASGSVASSITITDAKGVAVATPFTFSIALAPKITIASLAAGKINTSYSVTFAVAGGTSAYTWTSATPVPGLTLSSSGVLSGKPTTAASYSYSVKVTDAKGVSASITLPLTITKS